MRGLEGRVAVVTGASRGMAAGGAQRLNGDNVSVAVANVDADRAEEVAPMPPDPAIEGERRVRLADTPGQNFERIAAVNQRHVFLDLREALPTLSSQSTPSTIVTTSSYGGIVGRQIVGLNVSAAINGGSLGIHVSCIAPGLGVTRLTEARAAQLASVPPGRSGTPEDAASVIAIFPSDEPRTCRCNHTRGRLQTT